ncbi:MAG: 7-cyano-7-deazaguanine synthase QueC [Candidatus Bathyarchaeota archaeon]
MVKKEKSVVVLSGGPDSTTVAYWAKNKGFDVYAITYKYGQIGIKEVTYASKIAKSLGIPIKIIDLASLKEIFSGVTSVCDENIQMTSSFSQSIIVPFRNAIFLSIAVAYAASMNANIIFYGAQGSDEPFYPDCRREFYKSFEKTAKLGTGSELIVAAPFSSLQKSEVIKLGAKLGVPYRLTWSCYLNGKKHCGKCESCMNRKKAFREAGIGDPTDYIAN